MEVDPHRHYTTSPKSAFPALQRDNAPEFVHCLEAPTLTQILKELTQNVYRVFLKERLGHHLRLAPLIMTIPAVITLVDSTSVVPDLFV